MWIKKRGMMGGIELADPNLHLIRETISILLQI